MKGTGYRGGVEITADAEGIVSSAGTLLLAETAQVTGLGEALSQALAPWRAPQAFHDPGKIVCDVAVSLAAGGDCPADVAMLRAQQELFGPVASDPTVSRLVATLAGAGEPALAALRAARAQTRERAWNLGGAPIRDGMVVLDLDATLVTAHSEKENATPTWKKGFGFHPLLAFLDHGPGGTGEAAGALLRPGKAGANTAADHVAVFDQARAQIPANVGSADANGAVPILVRTDAAGSTHTFAEHLHAAGVAYSLGFTCDEAVQAAVLAVPDQAWAPAYNADGQIRDGAWVAEVTGMLDLTGWPEGMRVIVRKERPHPGAQLRFTDADGHRFTAFATNTAGGQLPDLETRHRGHARVEDRIRAGKDTGLANLPFHGFASNAVWTELVALAQDLLAWTQTLALRGEHAVAEPKRLRHRLFHTAGRLARSGRRRRLRLARSWPWAADLAAAFTRLRALTATA